MFIRSERLFLRPGWPEDWEELLSLIGDEKVVRHLANVPWPYTARDARAFIALPHDRLLPRFFITQPGASGARLVGGVGLHSGLETADGAPELGYWIARDLWGRGYASEAGRAVLSLARTLGYERIVATHFIDNPASGRVLEKIGFRYTGRLVERFSKSRGAKFPAREYERRLGHCDRDDDGGLMRSRRAA